MECCYITTLRSPSGLIEQKWDLYRDNHRGTRRFLSVRSFLVSQEKSVLLPYTAHILAWAVLAQGIAERAKTQLLRFHGCHVELPRHVIATQSLHLTLRQSTWQQCIKDYSGNIDGRFSPRSDRPDTLTGPKIDGSAFSGVTCRDSDQSFIRRADYWM